jgi:predicted component of type VI protein secretion system
VSRRHVRVSTDDDVVVVEDLGSANGTFVDGEEAHGPTRLFSGSQLILGVTVLELKSDDNLVAAAGVRVAPNDLTRLHKVAPADRPEAAPPPLAKPVEEADYVPPEAIPEAVHIQSEPVYSLLDVHTKSKAQTAPIAILVLVAFAVILYFGVGGGR